MCCVQINDSGRLVIATDAVACDFFENKKKPCQATANEKQWQKRMRLLLIWIFFSSHTFDIQANLLQIQKHSILGLFLYFPSYRRNSKFGRLFSIIRSIIVVSTTSIPLKNVCGNIKIENESIEDRKRKRGKVNRDCRFFDKNRFLFKNHLLYDTFFYVRQLTYWEGDSALDITLPNKIIVLFIFK